MRRALLSALLVALPLHAASAADAIEVLPDASAAPAEAKQVQIAKMKFNPTDITVKAGTVVTWTNSEALPHNVHFKAGGPNVSKDIEGPMLRANQTFSVRFNQAGTYDYICTPHPFMKAKVTVE
ncbi:amicyanin [Methylobacterium oxalidis]|uniref:Amicyanin n=1 Tax=Methylobacterium oxalidis TaxID=944322 RepID=A0A512IZF2_9HYPH|nr:amicyanin [Methylobacterium oxalidis]GEP03043.1 hypothetical protein MOX02_10810 [Methylobacterium oxalidis]GJE31679.1 Plastocyanin [Methylobacterium oxalidis]GLS65976.1 hypothetical protein GCM10007888_43580 [Methylobacterium oxalidis]